MTGQDAVYPRYQFADRLVVVTGGCSGIGAEAVRQFAASGARVAVIDIMPQEVATEIMNSLCDDQDRLAYYRCDISSSEEVTRTMATMEKVLGPVYALINNAGINRDKASWNMSDEDWDQVLDVDLKGAFYMARAVASGFRERKTGRIINVSSINGLRGKFGQCNYAAAKAGVIGMTKSLARELGPSNITVNAIAPGYIQTPMTEAMEGNWQGVAIAETVLKRAGSPQDVVAVMLFLCSDAAKHITGDVIRVDGGQYI